MRRITLEQINEYVGMPLTRSFICESLGIECDAAGTWDAKHYGWIVGRLQNHVLLKVRKTLPPEPPTTFASNFF